VEGDVFSARKTEVVTRDFLKFRETLRAWGLKK
jgi:hypothetical protein